MLVAFAVSPVGAEDGAAVLMDYVKSRQPGKFIIKPTGEIIVGPMSAYHQEMAGGADKLNDCVRGLMNADGGKVSLEIYPPMNHVKQKNLIWMTESHIKKYFEGLCNRIPGLRAALVQNAVVQFATQSGSMKAVPMVELLGSGNNLDKRLVKVVQEAGQISQQQAAETIWEIDAGEDMKPPVAEKVKTARKEVMAISAGAQVDLEKGVDMDRLMEDWRKARPGAQLQSPTPELDKIVRDIKDTPSGELKGMGLREPEIKFQTVIKERLEKAPVMQGLREKLPLRLEKKGLSPRVFQSKLREIMFNPSQLQLGGADAALGAFDVGASVAAGLVQTYDILFNRNLAPEQENLELGNAWVTTLPVVGDFAQGLITGGQGWYEGDKGKLLEAGLWVSIGIMGCVPGGQLPAIIASISLATKPLVAGVYDARQAQNLVQAWVESGDWAMDQKPRKLKGLFDREGMVHAITYEDLLTEKGNTPYKSEMADGLLGIDVTMNDSIRGYAEKYVMPQYTALTSLRDGLKSLYPDFDDKVWKDEFTAKYKIEVRGGKGGLALFNTYYVIRTKAFQQTIAQLKTWAEDEMRAAKDYDAEVARLKGELQALQDELKCTTLIGHADSSVEAYSRVIKNLWEQESLPLSTMRIYEHYVKTYSAIAGKLRRVNDLFRECSAPYVPSSWHLTGFPEFDVDRVNTLLSSMENGRKSVVEHIEKLLKDFDQPATKYDPSNECHKKTFDVLAPLRYKVAFVENMILYYKQLAEGSSTWTSAYDSAASRYKESRDSISTSYKGKTLEIVSSQRFIDSFMTYVAAIPYSLASGEAELYRSTARDYEVRLPGDRKEYEMATWKTGTGGETLQGCLLAGLKVELTLSPREPEEGQDVAARVRLTGGTPPKENYWHWKTSGGLTPSSRAGQEITLRVASEGTVTAELLDHFNTKLAKVLATASVPVKPKKKDDKKDEKEKPGSDPGKLSFAGIAPDVWEGGNYEDGDRRGFHLKRKKASSKGTGECKWEAYVGSEIWGKIDPSFAPRTEQEILSELNGQVENAKRWGKTAQIRPIAISDFKGHFMDTSVKFYGGGWSDAGFRNDGVSAEGRGFLIKGGHRIEIGYNVSGGGCWTNEDRAFLESMARAAQDEAKALVAGLQLVVSGSFGKSPYNGPKLDGSDMPKVTLAPPSLEKLKIGDTVKVTAEVQNDKPEDSPFTYNWGGTFDGKPADAKKKATITIRPEKSGKFDLSVSVDGQRFNMGGASLQYEVADYKVKIERVPADTKPVPVSVRTGFKATLTVDGKPASGTFIYRWQPHPEVTFDKLDSNEPAVNASFPKPGRVKVWVQVLESREGREATVAESAQLEIEVIKPQLELAFEPKEPYVGQELKAKLTVKPEMKEIDFRWMPVPDNAKQSRESKDGREITFYLKDDKPAEIKVNARVPKSGEDLGEAKNTVKAKKYAVNVTGPRAMGPKPSVWKEGVGLVDVENAIAVDQVVEFAADPQPAALTGPVKYQWTVSSGSCTVSNPTSREARATASAAGGCELSVVIKDKNDVPLGEGKGNFSASITREAIKQGQDKAKNVADAKTKIQGAKDKARKGDYDGAIKDAEDAAKLDPANKEAAATAQKLRQEKETIHGQIDKAKKLMDENKFADAQKELIVASNLNGTYPPVPAANSELGIRWNKYNSEVRDKVYEVRSANEKKDFDKALEIAAAWRASTKLDPYADEQLRQQENWAKQSKAQKDRQIGILKEAGGRVKHYDYAGALKLYDEAFAGGHGLYNGTEPEYKEAVELRSQAYTKNKRLGELTPHIRDAAENKDSYYGQKHVLDGALKAADEALALQPNNEQLKKWREQIVARAEKTKEDNERIAQGRKYLDAAGGAERGYLTNESSIQAKQIQWGEQIELQQHAYLTTAIENYRASLQYIPDANVEKKIKELEATLEGRKKHLENYRLSVTLKNEADVLVQQATKDPDIQTAVPKYDEAIEKYRKSLSLYRPFNAEIIERQMWNLETGKHDRWVRKYWADGQALEKEGKIVSAVAAYDKAIASFHPTVPQNDRMWIVVHAQEMRNRISGAKNWRADGEAKQKAGKIAEAIASYKQSLALLPDAALEEHVRMLEGKQAEAGEKKVAADRLWQEGTALFNQGRPSDALAKFKESLGYGSDPSRQKYVADLEARRTKAVALRDEGSKLQNQNRLSEAVAKYKESLTVWPDPGLSSHIATLEGKLKQDADTAARKAKAKQLRDEGYALQQRNQLQAAVGKYRESLAVWPDPQLEDYIRQLETKIASTSSIKTEPGPSSVLPRPGLYRIGSSGQTVELSAVSTSSMRVRSWQTATPEPPESRSAFYNAGTATPLGDGVTWRVENRDVAGYCCGNNVDSELRVLSPTSFRFIRYRLWPLNGTKPGPGDLWQPTGADEFNLVGELAGVPPPTTPSQPAAGTPAGSAAPLAGTWAANFNNWRGTFTIGPDGSATLEIGGGVETIADLQYEASSGRVAFTRPLKNLGPQHMQVFTGRLVRDGYAEGTFDCTASGKGFSWKLERTAKAGSPVAGSVPVAGGGGRALFTNTNVGSVSNNPTRATAFTLREPHVITRIQNYHWNNGRGAAPGTIALRGSDGLTYGPWQARGTPGQGGVPNANWECFPGVTLPAGTFMVIDSNPASWAQNSGSQGSGHTRVEGYPVSGGTVSTPAVTAGQAAAASSVMAELTNRSRENTHIFAEGETFGPGNRLAPGERRKAAVTMKPDGSVTFKAGRNGQVMATKIWRGTPGDTTRVPVVVFDDTNPYDKLTVTTGLR
jgi:tetratricopeptide (TPR) repeat protein